MKLIQTHIMISGFTGDKKDTKGVIPIETIVGSNRSKTDFFVVDANPSYHALLGRDWIHANKYIPSSMHQKLLLIKEDQEVETVEVDTQPFHTSSNCIEAQLYQKNVGPINIKEPIEDSPVDDWEDFADMPFSPFGPIKDENMV